MVCEFRIPSGSFDELLDESRDGEYYTVKDRTEVQQYTEKKLIDMLHDLSSELASDSTSITQPQHFDLLFSFVW